MSDAAAVAKAVTDDPGLGTSLYEEVKAALDGDGETLRADAGISLARYGLDSTVPEADWDGKLRKRWAGFCKGDWLEIFVHHLVRRALPEWRAWFKVHAWFEVSRRQFEVDVIALDGVRSVTLSVTTNDSLGLCKAKAFEAALRARQLGGDLARWGWSAWPTRE